MLNKNNVPEANDQQHPNLAAGFSETNLFLYFGAYDQSNTQLSFQEFPK
jgi:hypothetical protein